MIPRGAEAIHRLAQRIAADLIPKAPDAYVASDLGLITALLGLVAQDYDRAAEFLDTQDKALRPILQEAAAELGDTGLAQQINAALGEPPGSLRITDLTARADRTLRLLIAAHALVEASADAGSDWAKRMDQRIWRFLEQQTEAEAYQAAL